MKTQELLRLLIQTPELSTVGSSDERAAFIARRIDDRTVREAGDDIGVSKSNVENLANLFQTKLTKKMTEILNRNESTWSPEFRQLHAEASEIMPYEYDFDDSEMSREDKAEAFGHRAPTFDDE